MADKPIVLQVLLTPSDEVSQLREQVKQLEGELAGLRGEYKLLEYKFRCESVVNMELVDLLREHGIKYRPSLLERPYSLG